MSQQPMVQVVNGYVCMDCADVALAKKDINPAHPPNSPAAEPSSTSSNTQSTPAVTFGGSLSQLPGASAVQQPNSASQSQPAQSPYTPGAEPSSRTSSTQNTPAVTFGGSLTPPAQSPYAATSASQLNLFV